MEKISEIIQNNYDPGLLGSEYAMILSDDEIKMVRYRTVRRAIDEINYRRKRNAMQYLSSVKLNTEEGICNAIDYLKIDISSELDFANRMKHGELERREWDKQKLIIERERKRKNDEYWTAERMYWYMSQRALELGKPLVYDESNGHAIEALCYYFADDERFETKCGYSLHKGIILMGSYGTGKSFLPSLLQNNGRKPIDMHSMIAIEKIIKNEGDYNATLQKGRITYIDDVGTEKKIQKHYGNDINWFQQWIELMYVEGKDFSGLIFSTNADADEIEERYTGRVRSRLAEKMNIITLMGKDRRRL